jgi:biotin carboxyl carrier protein
MWYELTVDLPGGTLAQYKWPATATGIPFPDPGMWNEMTTGGGSCAQGVSITPTQIFTDQSPPSKIAVDAPYVFPATPRNDTGSPINGDAIAAHFRIADWGSALFDSPAWNDINSSCNTATGAPAPVGDAATFDLTCTWTLSEEERCQYRPDLYSSCSPMPDPRYQHQCILVELSSTTEVLFSRASAWRNMDFASASRFERIAALNIEGLPDLPTVDERDVYLHVTTRNLPAPPENKTARDQSAEQTAKSPQKLITPTDSNTARRHQAALNAGRMTLEQVAATMPTYIVHVYYDTGERVEHGGVEHLLLEPMPSFGYFLVHDGQITGWRHVLEGAIEVAPNFYKIGVNEETGRGEVTTIIEAVEPVQPPSPPRWWVWVVVILVVLLVIFLLLRRPTR